MLRNGNISAVRPPVRKRAKGRLSRHSHQWGAAIETVLLASAFSMFVWTDPVRAEAKIEAERVKEIAAMLPQKPLGFGRPITDRAAWEKLSHVAAFAAVVTKPTRLGFALNSPVKEATVIMTITPAPTKDATSAAPKNNR
jgi:hypothetical protein